ncbi:MAG: hypothetical protein ACTSVY_13980 [Candidatus Helarchaeota archaeon]
MFENKEVITKIIDKTELNLENLSCPLCNSLDIVRNGSYIRDIQDLGSIHEKVVIRLESVTLKCKSCENIFHHELEEFPLNYRYSARVIELSLNYMLEQDFSAQKATTFLEKYYQVDVSRKTLLKWLDTFGVEYMQKRKLIPEGIFENFSRYLTIDGTFPRISGSKNGKTTRRKRRKKKPSCLYLTRSENGILLASWE